MINPFPLYYDAECHKPVPWHLEGEEIIYDPINYGSVDELEIISSPSKCQGTGLWHSAS